MKVTAFDPPLRWTVTSETRPGMSHLVEVQPGGGTCSCENHTLGGNPRCKHINAAREWVLDLTITEHLSNGIHQR